MREKERTFRKVLCSESLMFLVIIGLILVCGTATATSPEVSVAIPTTAGLSIVPPVGISYELAPGSAFFQGCVGRCMCPVQEVGQIEGTFDLVPMKPTPLFTRYSMTKIDWTVVNSAQTIHRITGSGIYEIGGRASLKQQMTLFLSIDGKQPVTFDSGLVPITSPFPNISIEVDLGKKCYDLWITIEAEPQSGPPPPCMKNEDCSLNEFCLFAEGECSGVGVCTPKPDACPTYCLPLCGCDMKTYCNQCEAYANGVSILKSGRCR
jgi:hypothetical protein